MDEEMEGQDEDTEGQARRQLAAENSEDTVGQQAGRQLAAEDSEDNAEGHRGRSLAAANPMTTPRATGSGEEHGRLPGF